ncbi:hypothetical protein VPH35_114588 [Triticum aestivum]|uniref:uncharacterized protein n=1 Tax=Triticum aestivum TaxID=4565 RepID=UPI001D00ED52|nr:uncharacterized protein LOC123142878 [Triticum aestivum]
MKKLRAKVKDISNKNLCYRLIGESSGPKPTAVEEQASIATAAMFAAVEYDSSSKVDLHQLITSYNEDLRVIALWGTSGDLGKMSAIQEVYDDPMLLQRFGIHAWIRLLHPFNPREFISSLVRQFCENSHHEVGKPSFNSQEFLENLERVNLGSGSVAMFDTNKSRLSGVENDKLKAIHASCSLPSPLPTQTMLLVLRKNTPMLINEIHEEDKVPNSEGEEKVTNSTARKKFDRSRTLALADEVLCGQETEKSIIFKLVGKPNNNQGFMYIRNIRSRKRHTIRSGPACSIPEIFHGVEYAGDVDVDLGGGQGNNKDVVAPISQVRGGVHINFVKLCWLHIGKNDLAAAMMQQARVTTQKCDGLPLAILTIGGFLATKPKTVIEWRKMNDCISTELEINHELRTIKTVLMRSYDCLPYHLKYAFLYLSIFQEDHRIRWGRLNSSHLERLDVRGTNVVIFLQQSPIFRSCSTFVEVIFSSEAVAPLNRHDLFNLYRFCKGRLEKVFLRRGIGKSKVVLTLGFVKISGRNGNATLKELGELTQLRKLEVAGISGRNSKELWSAIAGRNQLQSLHDLSKLVLMRSALEQDDDAIQAPGVLPNLAVLCVSIYSFNGAQFHFHSSSFPSFMVLELRGVYSLRSVLFEEGPIPKLKLLEVYCCEGLNGFSGLPAVRCLNEIRPSTRILKTSLKEEVEREVADHRMHVRANIVN